MPLYDYRCESGHVTEAIRPPGTGEIPCPLGDGPALRTFSGWVGIVGPTTDLRGMFRRFSEASSEIDHTYKKVEADLERPVHGLQLWQIAKRRARAMMAAGEGQVAPPKS